MAPRRAFLWLTRILSLLAYGAAINYVLWRWRRIVDTSYWIRSGSDTSTQSGSSPNPRPVLNLNPHPTRSTHSIPFVLSEGTLLLLGSAAFYLQLAFYQRRERARMRDLGVNQDRWPTVDVMVPCFKEPIAVSQGAEWAGTYKEGDAGSIHPFTLSPFPTTHAGD